MWLGTGTMRRRGRACAALAREASAVAPPYPQILSWEVTEGRWSHDGSAWIQGPADQPRLYRDAAGNMLGYLIEGAETFYSAPWHDPVAPHTATDPAYLTKIASDAIAYAGAHSQPDIHGSIGKGVELTQGATANGTFTASNLKVAATGTADILRCEALFSIPETTGVAGTISLRNSQGRSVVLVHDASGNITGWNAQPAANTYRAGYAEAGVKSDGNKYWFAWFECYAAAAANVAPAINLPTAISGRKVAVHDLRILLNPKTAPKAVPVLAAGKTFAADTMVTPATGAKGVLFHRLGRCRTRVMDGKLSVATAWARSGPHIPYENRVELIDSAETSDVPAILPNEFEEVDFTPWPTNVASWSVILGPGYYNHRFVPTFNHITPNYSATSAFKADPALMAQVERFNTRDNYTSGNLNLDDLIVFSRASEVTTQLEQQDLPSGTSALNHFAAGLSLSAQRSLFVGHPVTHSRARAEEQEDETDGKRAWIGVNSFQPKGGAGSTLNLSGSHFWRLGRAALIDTAANTNTLMVTANDVFFDQMWSDCLYLDSGVFTVSMERVLFGRFTSSPTALYQSRKEIEVNTGSGWVGLSSSGLTVANLPFGRKATYAGSWNFASSVFTAAPDAERYLHVRYWKKGLWSATPTDKPGYQWHSTQARFPNEDRYCEAGDVYEVQQAGGPSTDKPWIRLTHDLGYWSNASTYWVGTAPAIYNTGTHADCFQTNLSTGSYESISGSNCVLLGTAQGMFLQGNAPLGTNDTDVKSATFSNFVMATDQSWSFYFAYSKTTGSLCSVSNALTLPMASRFRQPGGSASNLGIGAVGPNNTVNLTNVFAGYKAGVTAVSGTNSGMITGSHTRVGIGEIGGYAVTPPSGSPNITDMLDARWLDPITYAVRGDIDPLDASFAFTPYAENVTGMALNAILDGARGNHGRWNGVKAQIAKYHRRPDHTIMVAASSPIGTVVVEDLRAAGWKPLWSGNEKGYFAIENGQLKVAKALTGINQCWLLETDRGELILLDIR